MTARTKSVVGRGIVVTLFTAAAAYLVIAIVGSILVDLYGAPPPESTGGLAPAERAWCIRNIVGLRDELDSQVTFAQQHPQKTADPRQRWQTWDDEWLERLSIARSRCVGVGNPMLDRAYERLGALHDGYALAVESVIRTHSEVMPELQEALDKLKKQR